MLYSTQTSNSTVLHDNSVHTQNITNITIASKSHANSRLQPYDRAQDSSWDNLFANQPLGAIKKLLRCDLTDASQALLACFKFQHLNADAPERHSVAIKDASLWLYATNYNNKGRCRWRKADNGDLWDVLCSRRQDFHDIDTFLQAKLTKKSYASLKEGLDDIEDVTLDTNRRLQSEWLDYLQHVQDAIESFYVTK